MSGGGAGTPQAGWGQGQEAQAPAGVCARRVLQLVLRFHKCLGSTRPLNFGRAKGNRQASESRGAAIPNSESLSRLQRHLRVLVNRNLSSKGKCGHTASISERIARRQVRAFRGQDRHVQRKARCTWKFRSRGPAVFVRNIIVRLARRATTVNAVEPNGVQQSFHAEWRAIRIEPDFRASSAHSVCGPTTPNILKVRCLRADSGK